MPIGRGRGYGPAVSVYPNKQRGKVWSYDFWLNGVRHRGYCVDDKGQPAKNRTEAKAIEEAVRYQARQGQATARSTVRAGDYAIAQAQAALLKRVVDRRRKPEHVANIRLWGDHIMLFFGPETPFRSLTQKRVDEYVVHVGAEPVKKWLGGTRKPGPGDAARAELWRPTGKTRSKRQINNYLKHLRKLLAGAAKVKDPVTRQPVLTQDPELVVELERVPRRKPRPMTDAELGKRLAELTPWVRDVAELSRLFGLRLSEALKLEIRHIDAEWKALFFRGEETKSGHDEHAHGGTAGWQLLQRLKRQAIVRGLQRLVSWPGPIHVRAHLAGRKVPKGCWQPLKSLSNSWRKSAERAGVEDPHRFHDVRARYITTVAQADKASTKQAARHQDPATTDLYISVADEEVQKAVAKAVARRPKVKAAKPRRARS